MSFRGAPSDQSPFNPLPPLVVALAVIIIGIELAFQAGTAGWIGGREAVGWRLTAIRDWAVLDVVFHWMLETGQFPPREMARWLTYPLIHGGFGHAVFAAVFVLAFGNVTAPSLPGWRQLVLFFVPALAGALVYVILFGSQAPLIGGYPGGFGMIGAFVYLTRLGLTPADPSRAFLLIGFLLAIQPVMGVLTGAGLSWVPSWVAEATGAAVGYGLAMILFPGGMARLMARIRRP